MQSSRLKRYRHLVGRFDGLLTRTPVITYGLAIPFAVMGTVDARAAFALSVGMMAISLLSTAVGWVLKRMGQGREVYMLVTAVLSSLTLAGLSRLPLGGFQMPVGMLGIYFPLLAVNTLTFFLVTRCDEQKSLPANLAQAARSVLSFAFFVMAVSLFRQGKHLRSQGAEQPADFHCTDAVLWFYPGGHAFGILPPGEPVDPGLVSDQGPGRGHGRQDRGGEGIRWLVL